VIPQVVKGTDYIYDVDFIIDKTKYRDQLAIYSLAYGADMAEVHEVLCNDGQIGCAVLRSMLPTGTKERLRGQIRDLWDRVQNGHFFREMSEAESDKLCDELSQQTYVMTTDETMRFIRENS
jgi:hypothetical protein